MIDILAIQQGSVNLTGTIVETPLFSATIPGGIVGQCGTLRINMGYTHNLNANNKTFRVYYGGTLIYTDTESSANPTQSYTMRIHFRNSYSAQLVAINSEFTPAGATGNESTYAINGAVAQPLVFTGQLAVGTDSLSLDVFEIEALRIG